MRNYVYEVLLDENSDLYRRNFYTTIKIQKRDNVHKKEKKNIFYCETNTFFVSLRTK